MISAMQENLDKLVVDTTYNISAERYALSGLVTIHNEPGRTVPVGVSFTDSEDTNTIKWVLKRVAETHGEAWKSIRYVLSGGDWPTISGIDFAAGANAKIFICRYHVSRALFRNLPKAKKSGFGKS